MQNLLEKPRALYAKHAKWVPAAFFVLGFLFDALLLNRIDDIFAILQQAVYLALTGWLINLEFLEQCGKYHPGTGLWGKAWKYREAAIHFMLGTLLNAYALHPERFVRKVPRPPIVPEAAWINPPAKKTTLQDGSGSTIVTLDDACVPLESGLGVRSESATKFIEVAQ